MSNSLNKSRACRAVRYGLCVLLAGCDSASVLIGPPPGPATPGVPASPNAGRATDLSAVSAALADLLIHLEGSTGNSDNNAFATSVTDIQLCGFGRFGTRDFTSFASTAGDFSSEHFATGTWSIVESGGAALLRLNVEQSTDSRAERVREFAVEVGNGQVAINGRVARTESVSADCAAAQAGQAGS